MSTLPSPSASASSSPPVGISPDQLALHYHGKGSVGKYEEKQRSIAEAEVKSLRNARDDQKLNVPDELVAAVARMSAFDEPSLDRMIETARFVPTVPPRRQMATLLDMARDNRTKTTDQLVNQSTANAAESFISSYLMPGEVVIVVLPYSNAIFHTLNEKNNSRESTKTSPGGGQVYLTNKRVVLISSSSEVSAEFLDLSTYELSMRDMPEEIVSLQKQLAMLDTRSGLCTKMCPFLFMTKAKRERREQLQQDLEAAMELYPHLRKRTHLTALMTLLHDAGSCCGQLCGECCGMCLCLSCCCSKDPVTPKWSVNVSQSEVFNVMPMPLDRFLHAEMDYVVAVNAATGVERRDEKCCGLSCFAKTEFVPLARELAQVPTQRDVTITMSALMPPWNQKCTLRVRVPSDVPLQLVSLFLAKFHQLAPQYNVNQIEKLGVRTLPTMPGPSTTDMA